MVPATAVGSPGSASSGMSRTDMFFCIRTRVSFCPCKARNASWWYRYGRVRRAGEGRRRPARSGPPPAGPTSQQVVRCRLLLPGGRPVPGWGGVGARAGWMGRAGGETHAAPGRESGTGLHAYTHLHCRPHRHPAADHSRRSPSPAPRPDELHRLPDPLRAAGRVGSPTRLVTVGGARGRAMSSRWICGLTGGSPAWMRQLRRVHRPLCLRNGWPPRVGLDCSRQWLECLRQLEWPRQLECQRQ
jgi:hypothetical protein